MHDPLTVRRIQRRGDLLPDPQHLIDWQCALLQTIRQRLALEHLHDQKVQIPLLAHIEQRADVGVAELRDDLRLALETGAELLILGQARGQHLDRHLPIEARVLRPPHFAHATRAHGRKDLVRPEADTWLDGHGVG